jgi:hypothetical protein
VRAGPGLVWEVAIPTTHYTRLTAPARPQATSRFSTLFDDALAEVDTPTVPSRPTSSALLHHRSSSSAASVAGLPSILRSRVTSPADDYDRLVAATNGVPYAASQASGGGGRRAGAASTPAPRHGDLPSPSPFARTAARAPPKTKVSVPLRVGASGAAPASGEGRPGVPPLAYALPSLNTSSQPNASSPGVTPLAAAAAKAAEQHGAWSNWMETRLRDGARHSCAPILAVPSSPGGRLATLGVHASEMIDAALAGAAQEQRNAVDAMARMVQAATSGGGLHGSPMPSAWTAFATSLLSPGPGANAPGLAGLSQVVAQARQAAAMAVAASLSVASPDKAGALAEQRQQLADMERQLADAEQKLHVLNSKMSGTAPRSGEDGDDGASAGSGEYAQQRPASVAAPTPMPPGGAEEGLYPGDSMQPQEAGDVDGAGVEGDAIMQAAEHMWGDDGGQDELGEGGELDVHAAVGEANREAAAAVQAALALHAPTPMPSTAPNSRASTAYGYGRRSATPAGAHGNGGAHSPQPPVHLELTPEARRARMTQLLARKQQLQAASVAATAAKSSAEFASGAWAQAVREDTNPDDVLRVARAEAALSVRGSAAKLVTQPQGRQAAMEATVAAASAAQGARVRALLAAPLPSLRVPVPAATTAPPQGGMEAAGQAPARGQGAAGRRGGRSQFASANVVLKPRHRSRSPTRGGMEAEGLAAAPSTPSSIAITPLGVSAAAGAPQARRTVYSGTPQARKLVRFVPSTAPLGQSGASQPQSPHAVQAGGDDFYYDPEAPMTHAQRARAEAEAEAVRLAAQVHADVMAISELTAHMMASISGVMSPPQGLAGGDQERRPATDEERMRMVELAELDELEAASFPSAGNDGAVPAQPPPADDGDLLDRVTAAGGTMSVLDVSGVSNITPAGLLAAAAANPGLTCVHAGSIGSPFSLDQLEALWSSLWAPQLVEADLSASVPELSRLLALLSRRGLRLGSLTLTGGTLRSDAVRNLTAAVGANGGVKALALPHCFLTTDALAELLTSLPPCIAALDLRGNALAAGGAALLSRFLAQGPEGDGGAPAMVRSLALDDNAFTDADVALLAVGVARATWLDALSLRDCKLGPVAAGHLGRALGGPKVSLQSLDVSHNPLGDDGVSSLAACLRPGSGAGAGLHTLRLAHVAATGKGIRALVACLRGNASLAVLDVSGNALADGGARVLATVVGYPGGAIGLSSLDASACSIGHVGALELCHAVAQAWAGGCMLRRVNLAGASRAPPESRLPCADPFPAGASHLYRQWRTGRGAQ